MIVTTEQEIGVAHCLHGHKWVSPPVVCPYCEIASLRSGYLTDEHGNEYVQVCILKEKIREQEAEIERLQEIIRLVVDQDRTRGYPTGSEWIGLIEKIRAALAGSEEKP